VSALSVPGKSSDPETNSPHDSGPAGRSFYKKERQPMPANYWDKFTDHRVSRRRLLQSAGVATAAAGAVWLVGCKGDPKPQPVRTPGLPPQSGGLTQPDILNPLDPATAGGRYAVSLNEPFDTFDPHLGVAGSTDFFPRLYNSLVHQSGSRPEFFYFDLAQSYENPDPQTWNFKLRPGVRIGPNSLGVPERDLTGEDVVATFDRIKDDARTNNGGFVKQHVESVSVAGDIVTIRTTKPYAWFLSRVGSYFNTIPPRELLANDAALAGMRDRSAGAGAYTLTSSAEGEGATMERNQSHYRRDEATNSALPYIDGIDVKIITDRAAARTAFLSGQLHSYYPDGKDEANQIAGSEGAYLEEQPGYTFIAPVMNAEKPPFNDPRARRALALALNRDQYAQIVYGGDARANGLVHWTMGSYAYDGDALNQRQPFNLTEARQLVEAVGGISVPFLYPAAVTLDQHDAHLAIFTEQMRAAGIELEERPSDLTTWLEQYVKRDYELTLALNQVYETPEMPLDFHRSGGPLGDGSYANGLGDVEVDEAIDATKIALALEQRRAAVLAAQDVIWSKAPAFLPLVTPYRYRAHSSKLHNMPSGIGTSFLWLTTMWLAE
jgi:peptide/nickel transport system substrate-binding protein